MSALPGESSGDRSYRVVGAPSSEYGNGAAAAASRDLGAEEALLRPRLADQLHEAIRSRRAEAARGIARVRLVHQLAQQLEASLARRGAQQLGEGAHAEVLVDGMGGRRPDGVDTLRLHARDLVRGPLVEGQELRPGDALREVGPQAL